MKIENSKNLIIGDIRDIDKLQVGDNITKIYQILGLTDDKIQSSNLWEDVKKTKLFKELYKKSENDDDVKKLIAIIALLFTHIKLFEDFPDWSSHNIQHTKNIIHILDTIIPDQILKELNEIEITILLLSSYLHDAGIIITNNEKLLFENDSKFNEFQDKHFSIFNCVDDFESCGKSIEAKLLRNCLYKFFLKDKHYDRTFNYLKDNFTQLLNYKGDNFTNELALVSASHCVDTWELGHKELKGRSNIDKYRRNKKIGGLSCNLQYLAVCLKLGDVLSFDEEYFSIELFEYLGENESLLYSEWIRHLSIENWQITDRDLIYEVQCTHPVFQHYLFEYLDRVEKELDICTYLLADNKNNIVENYQLNISRKVNRDYIEPVDFIYGPLKFELDYTKVVTLLMGEQLYGKKNIVIRELLQNCVDACNHRKIIEQLEKKEYKPKISINLITIENNYVLVVEDNGVGMDLHIVQNYLINVGSSYYRSNEFEKIKNIYQQKGVEFDPVSRFGIGILSCFMIANKVEISTLRREAHPSKASPLRILIEGKNKFFIIKEEKKMGYGTRVMLHLKDDLIKDENIIFDDFNIFLKLKELVNKFAFHINLDVEVNGTIIKPKGYTLTEYLKYTKRTHKYFKIDRSEKDHSFLLNPIEIELLKNKEDGFKGKMYVLGLIDSFGKYSFSNEKYLVSDYRNVGDKGRIIEKQSLVSAIQETWDEYSVDEKKMLNNWFLERFGLVDNQDSIPSWNIILLRSIFWNHQNIFNNDVLKKKIEDGATLFNQKILELHSLLLNLQGTGAISCDGILINDGYAYGSYEFMFGDLPITYDINFTSKSKPNLVAARNSFINDYKLDEAGNNLSTFIGEHIQKLFNENKICETLFDRYYFLSFLANSIRPPIVSPLNYLLSDPNFVTQHFIIHVIIDGEEKYISLNEVLEDYAGVIYLPEYYHVKGKPNVYIFTSRSINSKLFYRGAKVIYNIFENPLRNYLECHLDLEGIINSKFHNLTCIYSGTATNKLFVRNTLYYLNSNHPFGIILDKYVDEEFFEMLMRLAYTIQGGRDEFCEDTESFISELNSKLTYFINILPDSEFKSDLSQIKFIESNFNYCCELDE